MSWLAAKRYFSFCKRFTYAIQNYDIELDLDPRRRSYKASVSLTLTVKKNTRQFCFLLSDHCTLHSINYLGLALTHSVKPAYPERNLITAVLPRQADAGERLVLSFIYSGSVPVQEGKSIELPPSKYWYPHSPCPQNYTCTLKVITPDLIRIVASGNFVREQPADTRTLTQWSATEPFRGIHILAGDFIKTTRETQPVFDIYYPRHYMNQGKTVADACEILLDFFTEKLGPAPASSGIVVLTDNPGPETNSSYFLTSISGGILEEIKEYITSRERTMRLFLICARELAHRWLKYNLTTAHPRYLWYLDGLAEYLSWLAVEQEYGKGAREELMREARSEVLAGPKVSIQSVAYGVKQDFPRWLVCKGSWILRTAHCLAPDKFLPALADIYTQCQNAAPAPEDFFLTLGNLTATDLIQLYKEWVNSDRQLRAEILAARTFRDDKGHCQLVFNLVNSGKLAWPHPIDIKMELSDGSSQVQSFAIQREPHLISTPAKIVRLTVDPEMKLLNWAENNIYKI